MGYLHKYKIRQILSFLMKVCVGGTFDIMHEGHKALISKAFEIGEEVFIGITADELADKLGKRVRKYEERKRDIEEFLEKRKWLNRAKIAPLYNVYGLTLDEDFDAIVVSPETKKRADEINEMRENKGMKKMKVVCIPYICAEDGIPITTTRIKSGEIEGCKRLKPLKICIGSKNKMKAEATKEVFSEFIKSIKVEYESVEVDTKKQPLNEEILQGAIKRAKEACKKADYGVGIESGMREEEGIYFIEQYVAIADKTGYITFGKSPSFQCPTWIIEEIKRGKEMKEIIPFKDDKEREKGAIWYFSRKIERKEITKLAVFMALLPRFSKSF